MGISDRKQREKEERRRQIMNAAQTTFLAKGFSGTTVEDIAGHAELSPSTIYLYFKNKEELYGSLSLQGLGFLLKELEGINDVPDARPEAKLAALKESLQNLYKSNPLLLLSVFHFQTSEIMKDLSDNLVAEIKKYSTLAIRHITKFINYGINQGKFKPVNPTAVADIVWSMFSGLLIWEESKRALDSEKQYFEKTFDLAFDLLCYGLIKENQRKS